MEALTSVPPADAARLLPALAEAGIDFVPVADGSAAEIVGGAGHDARVTVFVATEDADRARSIESRLLGDGTGVAFLEAADEACPACGTPLDAAAEACEECGLEFPEA